MSDLPPDPDAVLCVGATLRTLWPELRLLVLAFDGVRNGVGNRGLDLLRGRVVPRTREALAAHAPETIPRIAALLDPLETFDGRPEAHPPHVLERLRDVAARNPFPVENDVRDVATLASLYLLAPVLAVDRDRVKEPLRLDRNGGVLRSAPADAPILTDALDRTVDSFQRLPGIGAGTVHPDSERVFLIVVDPGLPDALDAARTARRLSNWMNSLTHAEAAGHLTL